jgi:hypothetical protein
MARGIHGLPKVSPRTALPNPSTPCGRATPETTLRPFLGWPAPRAGGLRPFIPPWIHHAVRACPCTVGRNMSIWDRMLELIKNILCEAKKFVMTPCRRPSLDRRVGGHGTALRHSPTPTSWPPVPWRRRRGCSSPGKSPGCPAGEFHDQGDNGTN